MKRVLAVGVGAAVFALVVAAFAPANQQAVTPAQFNALKKRVTSLELIVANCLAHDVAPVAAYGDPPAHGYAYALPDQQVILTSALDVVEPGDTPHYALLAVEPGCAAVIGGRYSALVGAARTTSGSASVGREHAPLSKR